MTGEKPLVEVAVLLPIPKTFTYEVPPEMRTTPLPGKRVWVPLGKRYLSGYVLGPAAAHSRPSKVLPLKRVFVDDSALSPKLLKLLSWTAHYYFQPLGEVIKTALPAGLHLRSQEIYALTAKGLEALKDLPSQSPERKWLQNLQRRQGKIRPIKGREMENIDRLLAAGWIEKKESSFEQRVKEKKTNWIRFLKKEESLRLSPRQKEALDFIRQAEELPVPELKAKYKNASSLLAKLKQHGLIEIFSREEFRQISLEGLEDWLDGPPTLLTDAQNKTIAAIAQALGSAAFHPFLLHGVTGSGKTEVYLRVIEEAIAQGRQALLLVPEIALTVQLVAYFRSRFEHPLAVLHSGLTPGERYDEWRRIKRGLVKLAIGARSAIFAPLENLGLIIVDEEHDPSYKQEEKVLYNARDLALVRGQAEKAVVVLGSATPSLESYHNVLQKKFHYLALPHRIDHRPLPEIKVVDMRRQAEMGKERSIFSKALEESLKENVARGEQALLFLNRRGFSTFALCRACGFVPKCPNCSVSLIYHLADKSFLCHYCHFSIPAMTHCPECTSVQLSLFGLGTQRLEEEIKKKFPQLKVGRLDRDTTARQKAQQKILSQVRRGEINLLVGTQMITKGHDLPRVTLVGVVAADLSLNLPDFRAGERTFQLLTQVAGRAGRGSLPGKVIVQTYNPNHYSIQKAQQQDFLAFYREEAGFRQEMDYPPFSRLINLRIEGNSRERVLSLAKVLEQSIASIFQGEKKFREQIVALGPTSAPLARLKGKHRYQILLKGKNWQSLHQFTEVLLKQNAAKIYSAGVKLLVDVDPVNML